MAVYASVGYCVDYVSSTTVYYFPNGNIIHPVIPVYSNTMVRSPSTPVQRRFAKLYVEGVPLSRKVRSSLITSPVHRNLWATPRYTADTPSQHLTKRALHNLPAQVNCGASTQAEQRAHGVNPAFLQLLMGYPAGWCAGGVHSTKGLNEN
jgi:hypothetical protein